MHGHQIVVLPGPEHSGGLGRDRKRQGSTEKGPDSEAAVWQGRATGLRGRGVRGAGGARTALLCSGVHRPGEQSPAEAAPAEQICRVCSGSSEWAEIWYLVKVAIFLLAPAFRF